MEGIKFTNLVQIGPAVVDKGLKTAIQFLSLVCHMSFLATDTRLCLDVSYIFIKMLLSPLAAFILSDCTFIRNFQAISIII